VQVASFVGVQTVDVATLPVPVHDVHCAAPAEEKEAPVQEEQVGLSVPEPST
jgi:hypothetical protein